MLLPALDCRDADLWGLIALDLGPNDGRKACQLMDLAASSALAAARPSAPEHVGTDAKVMYNRVAAASQMPKQVSALKVDLEELFSQSLC